MSSLNRRASSRNTRSTVNLENSVKTNEIVVPADVGSVSYTRPRSHSRGRRGGGARTCRQYPELDGKQMCTKEDYIVLK